MNIVEAYTLFKGQLIIMISGLSGCGKSNLAKRISRDFKIKHINQFEFYKTDYNKEVELPDGTSVTNWNTHDAIDWDKFNNAVNSEKSKGVVISGFALPDDHLDFKPDYHINLSISKKECLDRRREVLKKNKKKYKDEYELINTPVEKNKFYNLTVPFYEESLKNSKVNKFINIKDMDSKQVYDAVFDMIIDFIQTWLKQNPPPEDFLKQLEDKPNNNKNNNKNNKKDTVKDGPVVFLDEHY